MNAYHKIFPWSLLELNNSRQRIQAFVHNTKGYLCLLDEIFEGFVPNSQWNEY